MILKPRISICIVNALMWRRSAEAAIGLSAFSLIMHIVTVALISASEAWNTNQKLPWGQVKKPQNYLPLKNVSR